MTKGFERIADTMNMKKTLTIAAIALAGCAPLAHTPEAADTPTTAFVGHPTDFVDGTPPEDYIGIPLEYRTEVKAATTCLDFPANEVHFVKVLPSEMPGRKAETDGTSIWIDTDNIENVSESIIHEVSHIRAWTPGDWHGEEFEVTYHDLMESCHE